MGGCMNVVAEVEAVSHALNLERKIKSREARIGVAGLGYVGCDSGVILRTASLGH